VSVDSAPGGGTRFEIRLPQAPTEQSEEGLRP
jgi:signal transduction histidine kinase